MSDGPSVEQMTGAVNLGLLATNAADALGRTAASGGVSQADRASLEEALALLEAIRDPGKRVGSPQGPEYLTLGGGGLDVLSVLEARSADGDVISFIEPLANALTEAISGKVEGNADKLLFLEHLFDAIGNAEADRASTLIQPRSHTIPRWESVEETSLI